MIVAVAGLFVATSCKKDYACESIGGVAGVDQQYPDLDKDAADAAKTTCDLAMGTWVTK